MAFLSIAPKETAEERSARALKNPARKKEVVAPSGIVPTPTETAEFVAEYAALAERVGYDSPVLRRERLMSFLSELGLRTYDSEAVHAYLSAKFGETIRWDGGTSATWLWRPLREKDRDTKYDAINLDIRTRVVAAKNGAVVDYAAPYAKAVPMPVLLTIERVQERFPTARFFVSDETTLAERFNDPFLAVLLPGSNEMVIIERWDEPSFRG